MHEDLGGVFANYSNMEHGGHAVELLRQNAPIFSTGCKGLNRSARLHLKSIFSIPTYFLGNQGRNAEVVCW